MQILVVVANIHEKAMKAEVEKGSVRTVIGHGLVGPKSQGEHPTVHLTSALDERESG